MREKMRVTGEKHDIMAPKRGQWRILPETERICQQKIRGNIIWLPGMEQKTQTKQGECGEHLEKDNLINLFPTGIA